MGLVRMISGGTRTVIAIFVIILVGGAILGATPIPDAIATLLSLGVGGVYAYATWPPWPPASTDDIEELENKSFDERGPSEAADALSILETNPQRFSVSDLKTLATTIALGTQAGDEDAERVLAELNRRGEISIDVHNLSLTDVQETSKTVFGRLFGLHNASTGSPLTRAKNELVAKTKFSIMKYGFTGALEWDDMEFDEEHQIPENLISKGATLAIERFALVLPVPLEYYDRVIAMLESDIGQIRRSAAITLGAMGFHHEEKCEEVIERLSTMLEDDEKEARIAAVRGLHGPAMINRRAYELLEEVADGIDPDLREAAQKVLELVEEHQGSQQGDTPDEQIPLQASEEVIKV